MHPVTTATNISGPAAALWAHVVSDITAVCCTKCANVLPRSAFHKNKNTKNGLKPWCKSCANNHTKSWREQDTNKSRMKQYRRNKLPISRERDRERYKTEPQFKIKKILRVRLTKALERPATSKSTDTMTLLGCSIDDFKKHIEQKFQPGMSWENQGKTWHVDHILPCASFDLTQPEQQRACFSYLNIQPLFAEDNLRKGSKLDYHVGDENRSI